MAVQGGGAKAWWVLRLAPTTQQWRASLLSKPHGFDSLYLTAPDGCTKQPYKGDRVSSIIPRLRAGRTQRGEGYFVPEVANRMHFFESLQARR